MMEGKNTLIVTSIAAVVGLVATYYTARSNRYNIELTKLKIESEHLKLEAEKAKASSQKQSGAVNQNLNQVSIPKF